MEAMAASTPVIATEVGGVPELVEHDRHRPAGSGRGRDRVGRTIGHLLEDRDLRRSLAGRAREAVFDLTTTSWTDEYLAMIERL